MKTETNNIEFKEKVTPSLAKEIVAFLNTEDGDIYIGLDKKGQAIGIDDASFDREMRKVSDIVTDAISPRCVDYVHIDNEIIDNKRIIVVRVKKGDALYYIKEYGHSEKGVYIRSGSTCKSLTPEEIERRYKSYLTIPEKDITEMPSHRKNLTFRILKNYLLANDIYINEETFLENFHLLTKNGEFNYMAEILADNNDIVINVAVFEGKDKKVFLRREAFGGKCLLYAMEQALNYVNALNATYVKITERERKETKMFDSNAFREAWFNACVHNKWADADNPGIYVYSDRLEIESHGGIPKTLTKEQFLRGTSRPVNKKLFDIFTKCDFTEESGRGVPAIVGAYGEKAYEFSENLIDVIIPFKSNPYIEEKGFGSPNTNRAKKKTPKEIKKAVVLALKNDPYISMQAIKSDVETPYASVRKAMDELKKEGVISRIGPDKGGYWEILVDIDKYLS